MFTRRRAIYFTTLTSPLLYPGGLPERMVPRLDIGESACPFWRVRGVSAPVLVSREDDEEWARRQQQQQQQGGIDIGMRGMEGRVSHASLPDFYRYIEPERGLARADSDSDLDSFHSACSDLGCEGRCWEKKGDDDEDDSGTEITR